jgi:hypothetical protein
MSLHAIYFLGLAAYAVFVWVCLWLLFNMTETPRVAAKAATVGTLGMGVIFAIVLGVMLGAR